MDAPEFRPIFARVADSNAQSLFIRQCHSIQNYLMDLVPVPVLAFRVAAYRGVDLSKANLTGSAMAAGRRPSRRRSGPGM